MLTSRYGFDLKFLTQNNEDIRFLSSATMEISPRSGIDKTYLIYYTVSRATGCSSETFRIDVDFKASKWVGPSSPAVGFTPPGCVGPLDPFNENRASGPEAAYVGELVAAFLATLPVTPPTIDLTFRVDPRLEDTVVERGVREGVTRGLRFLSAMGLVPQQPHEILIAADTAWALPYLVDTRGCADGFCQVPGPDGSVVRYARGVTLVDVGDLQAKAGLRWQEIDEEDEFGRMAYPSGIVHEMGHWSQRETQRNNTGKKLYIHPSWMREGSADLIKMMAYAEATGKPWTKVRNIFLRYYQEKCLGIDFAELGLPGATGPDQAGCEYTNGWLMVEYLIWKTKDLFSWQKIFDAPAGGGLADGLALYWIDLEEFEKEVDAYVFKEACNWLKSCPTVIPKASRYLDQKYLSTSVPTRQSSVPAPTILTTTWERGAFTLTFQPEPGRTLKIAEDDDTKLEFRSDGSVRVKGGTANPGVLRIYSVDTSGARSMIKRVQLDFSSGRSMAWLAVP